MKPLIRPSLRSWVCLGRQYPKPQQLCLRSHIRHDQQRLFTSTRHIQAPFAALKDIVSISPEVRDAIATNTPVVALESTIYTHGALGVDLRLEAIVRENGAIPAVVGILDGAPSVGLSPIEVQRMVEEGARKVSRRDLAYLVGMGTLGHKLHGGTTIAGTMILSRLAGIRVFGTGGLGGVHRGWERHMDISADLTELGRTRVAVVSSGCKGFLDIPATLEYLETQGVLVSTFADGRMGDKVDFPAFWARESGLKSPSVVRDEREAAAMILAQERLGVDSGMLFANPIPKEFEVPRDQIEGAINQAVREAAEQGFSGNENTPFILRRIRELTDGRSVPANVALVQANVAKAARIAVELSKLASSDTAAGPGVSQFCVGPAAYEAVSSPQEAPKSSVAADVLVAGSVALDLSCDLSGSSSQDLSPTLHTSNPASISQSVGGVGRNVALAAHMSNSRSEVHLCSMVGDDIAGDTILSNITSSGLNSTHIRKLAHPARTAQYVAVNTTSKALMVAMADMDIFSQTSLPEHATRAVSASKPKWLVVDGNWSSGGIYSWINQARKQQSHTPIAFEPVSVAKSARLFPSSHGPDLEPPKAGTLATALVDLATPNQAELLAMWTAAKENGYLDRPDWFAVIDAFGMRGARDRFVRLSSAAITDAGIPVQSVQLLPYIPTIITKMGAEGVLLTALLRRGDPRLRDRNAEKYILVRGTGAEEGPGEDVEGVYMRYYAVPEKIEDVVSVNGVGDTFLGALVAGLAAGGRVENLVDVAQKAAGLTLRSRESVSQGLGELEAELLAAARGH